MGRSFKVGKLEYYGDSLKNPIFSGERGGVHKKPIYRGEFPKKRERLEQFADLQGCRYPNAHYDFCLPSILKQLEEYQLFIHSSKAPFTIF